MELHAVLLRQGQGMIMQADAYFFDFDGVIVDSVPVKAKAFALLFENYGSEIQEKVIEHHLNNGGMTRKEKIHYYFENYVGQKVSENTLITYCGKFSKIVEKEVVAAPEIAGAVDFLQKASKKTQCFIVSATPDDELIRIVAKRDLKKYFIEILGSDRSKTENLFYLIKKYNLVSLNCKFFGDAMSDHNAAKNCSVPFVGIIPDIDAPLYKNAPDITWSKNFMHSNIEQII
jgi:phosphoglycolate phosphatase-like HAD superfamily hydrolase